MMFLAKVFGFVRGIGPIKYILTGMVAIIMTLSAMYWSQGKTVDKLQLELAQTQEFAVQCVQVNQQNKQVFDKMAEALKNCSNLRSAAEDRGNKAIEDLALARREAYMASRDVREEVNDEIAENADSCINGATLPARASGLLIAAADSANRDS